MVRQVIAGVILVLLFAGCSEDPDEPEPKPVKGQPVDANPHDMVASPANPAPGQVVDLTFPPKALRGIAFTLTADDGSETYLLTAGREPSWSREGVNVVVDIGVSGPGPDRVVIPDVATPGTYQLCTGNASVERCVAIEVED